MGRVIQISSALLYGDAVGNVIKTVDSLVKHSGREAAICAGLVHPRVDTSEMTLLENIKSATEDDILIYHVASAYDMVEDFAKAPGKKVIIYHNITPPEFFRPFDSASAYACSVGLQQTKSLAGCVDFAMADSAFNKADLIAMGYTCPIDVVPVLVDFDDYTSTKPNEKVLQRMAAHPGTNVMFMGRVVPNKKIQDVIRAFYAFQCEYDPDAHLTLTGSFKEDDSYYRSLVSYIEELGVRNVVFPGHIGFDEVISYYQSADVFLCQSEHEGFCVPLLEAFCFDIPVVAYDAGAVGETMGGAGTLLDTKDPSKVAAAMHEALQPEAKEAIIAQQRQRLEYFSYDHVSAMLFESLSKVLGE